MSIDKRVSGGLAGAVTLKATDQADQAEKAAKTQALTTRLVGSYASLVKAAPEILEIISRHVDAHQGDPNLARGASIRMKLDHMEGSISLDPRGFVSLFVEKTSDFALRSLGDASYDDTTMQAALQAAGTGSGDAVRAAFGSVPNAVGYRNATLFFVFPVDGLQSLLNTAATSQG